MVQPRAPELQAWTARSHTKHESKSSTKGNDAIWRRNQQGMSGAAAGVTGPLSYDKHFFFISRKTTLKNKDKKYSRGNTKTTWLFLTIIK